MPHALLYSERVELHPSGREQCRSQSVDDKLRVVPGVAVPQRFVGQEHVEHIAAESIHDGVEVAREQLHLFALVVRLPVEMSMPHCRLVASQVFFEGAVRVAGVGAKVFDLLEARVAVHEDQVQRQPWVDLPRSRQQSVAPFVPARIQQLKGAAAMWLAG